jgi:hypothetical protein
MKLGREPPGQPGPILDGLGEGLTPQRKITPSGDGIRPTAVPQRNGGAKASVLRPQHSAARSPATANAGGQTSCGNVLNTRDHYAVVDRNSVVTI